MAETLHTALSAAAARLAGVSDTPRLDAEVLMAHALAISREALLLGNCGQQAPPGFASLIERRLAHEPVAYIVGERDFWTITLSVGPGVLIPRPDSETLIEAAIAHFGDRGPATILDLGTGSGALLLACLDQWPKAHGIGVDSSEQALAYARANARRNRLEARATFMTGDWCAGVDARFDLILCNPPYVEADAPLARQVCGYEPARALFAGPEGLDDYRRLIPQLPRCMQDDGIAILEIGSTQADAVSGIAARSGFKTALRHDLAGRPRAMIVSVEK